jgi:hypothetical protein
VARLRERGLRALLALLAVLLFVTAAIAINGSISFWLGGLHVRARSAFAPLIGSVALVVLALILGRGQWRSALAWWWFVLERHAAAAAVALASIAVVIGVNWGTFAAGGSDSYCYLNQAELFARGEVRDIEPLATDSAWTGSADAFVPVGHNPSPAVPGSFVPMCPAGYPLLLAATRVVFGREAMFWVTPAFGALAVWFAFVLGRRIGGPAAGILASALTLTSPIFLYQVVQPMNDIVAAALWAAALSSATWTRLTDRTRSLLTGVIAGAAVTIRPNLVPLAGAVALCAMVCAGERGRWTLRERFVPLLLFALAVVPGVLLVMGIQHAMYGSPFRSGYGDLSALFSWTHIAPNFVQYARWTAGAHTMLIALAFAAPLALRSRRTAAGSLLFFALATLACYLPYVVFDAWWYQRFLLPGILPVLVLTSAVVVSLISRLEPAVRVLALLLVLFGVPLLYIHTAVSRSAFRLQELEARFRSAGEYAARLPPESVFVTASESGSVRFYTGRTSAVWLGIEPGKLGEALDFFRARGRKPYLLLETGEESAFRERFAVERLGGLEWPPIAEIDRAVRIYDPDDYARYMRGEFVKSERILTRRPR